MDLKEDGGAGAVFLQVLMQNAEVGKVIGKKGAIVKMIKAKSQASISISEYSRTIPRIASVKGTLENVVTAVRMITLALNSLLKVPEDEGENLDSVASTSLTVDSKSLSLGDNAADDLVVTLMVQQGQIGSIIGKGGSRINKVRQSTNAKITVTSDSVDRCGNTIRIQGTEKQIVDAAAQVAQLIQSNKQRKSGGVFGMQNLNLALGATGDSSPLTTPGENIDTSNSPINSIRFGSNMFPLQQLLQGSNSSSLFSLPYSSGAAFGLTPSVSSVNSNSSYRSQQSSQQSSITVVVPNPKVGVLIGRKGSTIQRIKAQSGAIISVSDYEKGVEDRLVTIRSSNIQSIRRALALVLCTIDSNVSSSSMTLSVPTSALGSIIGRKGARIQHIRQTTGAATNIEKDGTITISGPRVNVWIASVKILDHLSQHQLRSSEKSNTSEHKSKPSIQSSDLVGDEVRLKATDDEQQQQQQQQQQPSLQQPPSMQQQPSLTNGVSVGVSSTLDTESSVRNDLWKF